MAHFHVRENPAVAISPDDRAFFQVLGARIAQLRKEQNITQVQLAYEAGHRRVPVSALPILAQALATSVEDLIGSAPTSAAKKRGPAPKLQQQMERIAKLPKTKQKFVIDMLDAVLTQQG